jgi:hypothetical protein
MTADKRETQREELRRTACRAIRRFHRRWRTADLSDGLTSPLAVGFAWELLGSELREVCKQLGALIPEESQRGGPR